MIKIITGISRCGKSFLLFVLFKKYLLESGIDKEHIIEISLNSIENEDLRDPMQCEFIFPLFLLRVTCILLLENIVEV